MFLGLAVLISIGFFLGGISELISKGQYLQAVFLVIGWFVFAGFDYALGTLSIRALKRWWQNRTAA